MFDRKTEQQGLAGDRAAMKRGEEEEGVGKRVRLRVAQLSMFSIFFSADSCR
jgi:hypothetical protein